MQILNSIIISNCNNEKDICKGLQVSFSHKLIESDVINHHENEVQFTDMGILRRIGIFLLPMFFYCTYNITYNF